MIGKHLCEQTNLQSSQGVRLARLLTVSSVTAVGEAAATATRTERRKVPESFIVGVE